MARITPPSTAPSHGATTPLRACVAAIRARVYKTTVYPDAEPTQAEPIAPPVLMSREDASNAYGAINLARGYLVDHGARIRRSRTMTEAAKQHDAAGLRQALDALVKLQEAIGTAHNLGGY